MFQERISSENHGGIKINNYFTLKNLFILFLAFLVPHLKQVVPSEFILKPGVNDLNKDRAPFKVDMVIACFFDFVKP